MPDPITAILFDLDGTLADTAIDLYVALNRLQQEEKQALTPLSTLRQVASNGSIAMISTGFGVERDHPRFRDLQQRFLQYYRQALTDNAVLMPGMEALLQALAERQTDWGIVTNKPGWLTDPLVETLPLPSAPKCVISGDTVDRGKPHPDSLLHACRLLQKPPQECLYVGDAERDIQAGRSAGMRTVAAGFGYISVDNPPRNWQADYTIDHPEQLLNLLTDLLETELNAHEHP